jgi:DNA modification methylase
VLPPHRGRAEAGGYVLSKAKRVERIGNAVLYLGDCRGVIPTLSGVGAVVTDPPYGIEDIVGSYGRDAKTIANDRNLDCCFEALDACAMHLRPVRIVAFYAPRITNEFFQRASSLGAYRGEIVWDKRVPGMGGNGLRYQHESVSVFDCGTVINPIGNCISIQSFLTTEEGRGLTSGRQGRAITFHPHQKPIDLMGVLVGVANGDVVLDPFMGSGSTGVAALKTGRSFIGCEIDEGHFETALRRITEATKEGSLF